MKSLRDIYFLNAAALAQELRTGSLSQYRAVKHFVAIAILGGIGFEVPVSVEFKEVSADYPWLILGGMGTFIASGIIAYFGVWLAFQINEKGDGKDFFLRFSILTLPIFLQLILIFLPIGLALVAVIAISATAFQSGIQVFSMAVFYAAGCAFQIMFYLRMRKYIALAAGISV